MKRYFTLVDDFGARYGEGGVFMTINHRAIIEGKNVYGYESMLRVLPHQDLFELFGKAAKLPSGTTGQIKDGLWWHVDDE